MKIFALRKLALSLCIFCLLFTSCEQPVEEKIVDLPRSTPEAEGVSSAAILDFIESADTSKHEFTVSWWCAMAR